jgi:hypothetical protein
MRKCLRQIALLTLALFAALAACTPPKMVAPELGLTTGPQVRGVNRAGAEYGEEWDGWTGRTYYEWPSVTIRTNELNYFASKGMNVVRLPISWERLQHTLSGPLDPTYQANLVAYVRAIRRSW